MDDTGDDDLHSDLETELESLQAIFIDEITFSRKPDGSVDEIELTLHPSTGHDTTKQYVCMKLVFRPPPQYPNEVPELEIRNPRGLGEEEIESLAQDMKLKAEEYKGEPVLYTLIEMARDSLTEGNVPHCPCVVCLEHFDASDSFHRTGCYHYFHTRCLHMYLEHTRAVMAEDKKRREEEGTIHHNVSAEEKSEVIVCPLCREPLDAESLSVTFDSATNAEEEKFVPSEELREQQRHMAQIYERQKAKGGIIDLEAEKNKYLVNPDTVVVIRSMTPTEPEREAPPCQQKSSQRSERREATEKGGSSRNVDRRRRHEENKDGRHNEEKSSARPRGRGRGGKSQGQGYDADGDRDSWKGRGSDGASERNFGRGRGRGRGRGGHREGQGYRGDKDSVTSEGQARASHGRGSDVDRGCEAGDARLSAQGERSKDVTGAEGEDRERGERLGGESSRSHRRTDGQNTQVPDDDHVRYDGRNPDARGHRRGRGRGAQSRGRRTFGEEDDRLREGVGYREEDGNRRKRQEARDGEGSRSDAKGEGDGERDGDRMASGGTRREEKQRDGQFSSNNGRSSGGGHYSGRSYGRSNEDRDKTDGTNASGSSSSRTKDGACSAPCDEYGRPLDDGGGARGYGQRRDGERPLSDGARGYDRRGEGRGRRGQGWGGRGGHREEDKDYHGNRSSRGEGYERSHGRDHQHPRQNRDGANAGSRNNRRDQGREGESRRHNPDQRRSQGLRREGHPGGEPSAEEEEDEDERVSRDIQNLEINQQWRRLNYGHEKSLPKKPLRFGVYDDDDEDELRNGHNEDNNTNFDDEENNVEETIEALSRCIDPSDSCWEDEIDPYAFERRHIHRRDWDKYCEYRKPYNEELDQKLKDRLEREKALVAEERRMKNEAERKRAEAEEKAKNPTPVKSILDMFKEKKMQKQEVDKTIDTGDDHRVSNDVSFNSVSQHTRVAEPDSGREGVERGKEKVLNDGQQLKDLQWVGQSRGTSGTTRYSSGPGSYAGLSHGKGRRTEEDSGMDAWSRRAEKEKKKQDSRSHREADSQSGGRYNGTSGGYNDRCAELGNRSVAVDKPRSYTGSSYDGASAGNSCYDEMEDWDSECTDIRNDVHQPAEIREETSAGQVANDLMFGQTHATDKTVPVSVTKEVPTRGLEIPPTAPLSHKTSLSHTEDVLKSFNQKKPPGQKFKKAKALDFTKGRNQLTESQKSTPRPPPGFANPNPSSTFVGTSENTSTPASYSCGTGTLISPEWTQPLNALIVSNGISADALSLQLQGTTMPPCPQAVIGLINPQLPAQFLSSSALTPNFDLHSLHLLQAQAGVLTQVEENNVIQTDSCELSQS